MPEELQFNFQTIKQIIKMAQTFRIATSSKLDSFIVIGDAPVKVRWI